ncbi:MAG: glycosyltransferase family 2 protein [Candidatus Binataceae bacterium]
MKGAFERTRMDPTSRAGGIAAPAAVAEVSPKLSIIVPMFNEAPVLDRLFGRLAAVMDRLGLSYEIVVIDDGSTDETLAALLEHRARNPAIKVLSLSRTFGKDIALSAGLDYARGRAVVPLDADLQDPPELIEQMVTLWREGYDVIYATRKLRPGDTWLKRTTAHFFYRIFEAIADVPIPRDTGDFRLLDRRVVDVMIRLPERTRFMKGLFAWVGFKQTAIYYEREERQAGGTKWNYWRLWNFAMDGITSFSSFPLMVWSYFGFVISGFAFLYAVVLAVRKLLNDVDVPGYTSLMVVVLFLGGIQLITLGILGEYMGRVYNEVKGRPLYVVRDLHGFDDD